MHRKKLYLYTKLVLRIGESMTRLPFLLFHLFYLRDLRSDELSLH